MELTNVFVTEGMPLLTFVEPPNFNEILIDVKKKGKPVVIEGQSGTGKTCTIHRILSLLKDEIAFIYYSARKREDISKIIALTRNPSKGNYVIDDFHRLPDLVRGGLSNMAKIAADEGINSEYPKLVLIGINHTGDDIIEISPDIAKRCGIHKVQSGYEGQVIEIIKKGEDLLNIKFDNLKSIFNESKGDYWLTQKICLTICTKNNILYTQNSFKSITANMKEIRKSIINSMETAYHNVVKEFCRGKRYRPTNDAYIKFLHFASSYDGFPIDLNELEANAPEQVKISINSIKDHRLLVHIKDNAKLSSFFYYNKNNIFNIEDPALQYYIRFVDWDKLYKESGFIKSNTSTKYDIAISYASENRALAKEIADLLIGLDYEVFYDETYENKLIGSTWSKEIQNVFSKDSDYVVCILDEHYKNKIWTTFEKECFIEKVGLQKVIPIFLDKTIFLGIPNDLIGIKFHFKIDDKDWKMKVNTEIINKIISKVN